MKPLTFMLLIDIDIGQDEELLKSTKYLVPSSLGREPSPYTAIINGVGQVWRPSFHLFFS